MTKRFGSKGTMRRAPRRAPPAPRSRHQEPPTDGIVEAEWFETDREAQAAWERVEAEFSSRQED
jgi:hypothetical protein